MNSLRNASPLFAQGVDRAGRSIESANSLDSLVGTYDLLPKNRKRWNFTLNLSELSQQECATWEARLKRYYFVCGCMEGSLGSFGALIGYAAYLWFRPAGFAVGLTDGLYALGLFVAAGLAGKVIGLIYNHKRLQRTIVELKAEIQKRETLITKQGGAP